MAVVVNGPLTQRDIFQNEEIAFAKFRIKVEVTYSALAGEGGWFL